MYWDRTLRHPLSRFVGQIVLYLAVAAFLSLLQADETNPLPTANTQQRQSPGAALELERQALHLLQTKCASCHGAEKAEGRLRLDSREAMLKGGEHGSAVNEDNPLESLLWQSVAGLSQELEMPPRNPLLPSELSIIERWLQAGAHWSISDSTRQSMSDLSDQPMGDAWSDPRNPIVRIFGGQRLDLWSLKPVQLPTIPAPSNSTWPRSDLDRLVLARFMTAGVEPPAMADRHTLLRRLCFDLTGLPPSPETVAKFQRTGSEESSTVFSQVEVEQLVDQLLGSEQFGQHWARMWLDVARYSDSNGFDWDEFRPQAWRFRDYVIRSLNADKPFDRFVQEQLAGDELFSGQPQDQAQQDALIATGFLRLGPHDNAAKLFNEQDRSRDELLTDLVETTGSAFLGITLSCCRCHDHKYDPFSQADHFRLRACFAGVTFADDLSIDLVTEHQGIEQHNARIDAQIMGLEAEKKSLLQAVAERLVKTDSNQPAVAIQSTSEVDASLSRDRSSDAADSVQSQRSERNESQLIEAASEAERQSLDKIKEAIQLAQQQKRSFTYAMLMVESPEAIPSTFVLYQGNHKLPREKVDAGILSILNPNSLVPAQTSREGSSGRRLALAQWITSPDNPLTARVFLNRVWQSLMGRGLVATPGDFGLAGANPEEPELLDWLASRFIDEGWSIKKLVRTIVLSATYQQAAIYGEPVNELSHLLRFPRRLTAEQLRDAMLSVSGLLTSKSSGPPEWPDLPRDVLEANPAFLDDNETKTKGWYPSPLEQQYCRSVFLVQKRNTRVPLLETFDQPENSVCCARRMSSVVAPQALSLLNSPVAVDAARSFAARVATLGSNDAESIQAAFELALQREPTASEIQACQQLLHKANWVELCRVLLNINEFAYID